MASGVARVEAARDAVTAAAAARWRLRIALLVAHDTEPVVSRYLIGREVVFEAVHHVPPNVTSPLTTWTVSTRRALAALGADDVEPSADAVAEQRRPHRLHRGGVAVDWFTRLVAYQRDGGNAALGVHLDRVCVHPETSIRRAGAIVDVVAPPAAPLGHRDRLVLARVRCPSAESAAALYRELQLDFTAEVEVLGPDRRDEAAIPLLERMAMVEDQLYLAATRMGRAAADH